MANEIRLRSNNQFGTITDNPLTVGATSITSAAFTSLPTVDTTNHLLLTLDPNETGGAAEIVKVTAHTAASDTVTVVRAQEGTSARSHVQGTTWMHAPVASDFVPFYDDSSGVGQGVWQDYTPPSNNITVGDGTQTARFSRIGDTVTVQWYLAFGTTTAFTSTVEFGLPVLAAGTAQQAFGVIYINNSGTQYTGIARLHTNDVVRFAVDPGGTGAVATLTNAAPAALGNGDVVTAHFSYEAA